MESLKEFVKDPQAVLDYSVDWTRWLNGDVVVSAEWAVVPDGLSQPRPASVVGSVATIWLGGGVVEEVYTATCHVVTAAGREDDRSLTLLVRQR